MSDASDKRYPSIVSIQSQLIYGCAGNNAAVPLLQSQGATVYAVPTVLMSNTPHYPTRAELELSSETVEGLLSRLLERVSADSIDAVLVGYIRHVAIVGVVSAFIDRIRSLNPDIVVVIDPVMGDTDLGLFVPGEVASLVCSELVPRADVLTPNLFEAGRITGLALDDRQKVLTALSGQNARLVLVSGIGLEAPGSQVQTSAFLQDTWSSVSTPYVPLRPTGTGDLLAAGFLFHWLCSKDVPLALRIATALVLDLMQHAVRSGKQELEPWHTRVLAEQELDELVPPSALSRGMP